MALLEAVIEDEDLPPRLLLWAGADPHRKVLMARDIGRPDAWDSDAVFSSAEAAITFGRPQLFDLLRIESMPGLDTQAASAPDSSARRFGRARPGMRAKRSGSSNRAGRLTRVSPDELRYLRRELLEVRTADDFSWLLRWLNKPKNGEHAVYEEMTRTASVRQKLEALNGGTRYLSPSQKMSRANERRRRATERKPAATPNVEE